MAPLTSAPHLELPAANIHPMNSSGLLRSLLEIVKSVEDQLSTSGVGAIIPLSVLRQLLNAMHFRDLGTLKHVRRVAMISVGIGTRLGWEEQELQLIEIASLLHDIGKIGIPDHILGKPGALNPDEADYITAYHRVAVEFLQACRASEDLVQIISQSHGISTAEHPHDAMSHCVGARILAVADAYESLTSDRSYRHAFDQKDALKILRDQSGKEFDRNVVAALERWLKTEVSSVLDDHSAVDEALQANAPRSHVELARASQICQLFQYLHLLESLYDAYYVIDSDSLITIWGTGATTLFGAKAEDLVGQHWHRSLVASTTLKPDPIDIAFREGRPNCHSLELKDVHNGQQEFDVQSFPVLDEQGAVIAVAELICDSKESKQHRGQFQRLEMAATRDALTGVLNRSELDEQLGLVFEKWEKERTIPFSLLFLDIDHFKPINDRLSHAVGDRVLIDVARLVQDELYSGEIIARYGGEEFLVVCPETPLESGIERAERLRRAISQAEFADRDDLKITVSVGVTQVEEGDTVESVLNRADEALYDAKNAGRDQTAHRVVRRKKEKDPEADRKAQEWSHEAEIITCVASSMLPMKLKGYVVDEKAKLLEVSKDHVHLHLGSSGLLGGWGSKPARQPVSVKMKIEELPRNEKISGTQRILLKLLVEPIGKPAKYEIFYSRAAHIVEGLRAYLIAD